MCEPGCVFVLCDTNRMAGRGRPCFWDIKSEKVRCEILVRQCRPREVGGRSQTSQCFSRFLLICSLVAKEEVPVSGRGAIDSFLSLLRSIHVGDIAVIHNVKLISSNS